MRRVSRLMIIIIMAIVAFFAFVLLTTESYDKEEILKLADTKDLFFSMDDSKKVRKFIPYDIISNTFYVSSGAELYDMNNFDSKIIKRRFEDPKYKAPNGPRTQNRLIL